MTYEEAVRRLARWHRESDLPPERIILFRDPGEQVIRLVYVTEHVPETGEFYPFQFGRSGEIPYVHIVAQVTRPEWEAILRGDISLPDGWDLQASEEVGEEVAA